MASPSLFFGEAIMRGDILLDGSYPAIATSLEHLENSGQAFSSGLAGKAAGALAAAARSLSRQKNDIHAHYDLGNDFFRLWLDKETQNYSCAYFRTPSDTLEQAQKQKAELILRKLRLKPGMRVLDIGCGWGWQAMQAAKRYGVEVVALTLSEEQYSACKERFSANGVEDAVDVQLRNYLEFDGQNSFDRVVSVGMFEHVGQAHYRDYFAKVNSLLKPGGLSLLHTLTKIQPGATDEWILKYIFPGGHIPALAEVVDLLPDYDFHLVHMESLRRHYVRTLDCWYDNFPRKEVLDLVREQFGDPFIRMWSLYLRMASAYLWIGGLDVHQFVFTKAVNNDLPMTLEDIYDWS